MQSRPIFIRLTTAAVASAALLFGLAGVSEAVTLVLRQEVGQYSSTTGGGEFKVTDLTGFPGTVPAMGTGVQVTTNGVTGAFQTFCMEYTEHFTPGTTYDYTVDTAAYAGGFDGAVGTPPSDPVSSKTAYLYTQFWNGVLSWTDHNGVLQNYTYALGNGRASDALELQNAIWFIEGERTKEQIGGETSDAWKMYLQAKDAVAVGGSWWNLYHDENNLATIGNVRVMNLTAQGTGAFAQSQLTMIAVPLPPAAFLGFSLMSGAGLAGWLRRRRRAAL
jgi:hypothetical protein